MKCRDCGNPQGETEHECLKWARERIAELDMECKRLWSLLDDISTCGDMYKPERTTYFTAVNCLCESRDGLFYSDGYRILPKEQP